jgi:glycosyltransferase involved in cell wall biosynthesis
LAAGDACTLSYFRSEALRTRLAERLRKTAYDLVLVSSSTMIQYALEVDAGISLAVDFGEVDSEWWVRQAARGSFPSTRFFRTEAMRLRMAEEAVARRAVLRLAASPEAADVVKSFAGDVPTVVIPNGLETDVFGVPPRRADPPTIVFNTSLASDAQIRDAIEFHRTVMTIIRSRVPGSRLLIVSKEPLAPPRLGGDLPGATVAAGIVDPGPLLRQAAVAVAPLRNRADLRSAVLEPMAASLPVVATSAVLQGLAVDAGHELLVADEPIDFALKVIRLLEDETLRTDLGRGRSFVPPHAGAT